MIPVYVTKSLIAASSTGIGTLSSASPGVATLNASNLDTSRRIIIASASGTLATASFKITGTREGGGTFSETITGPTSVGGTSPTTTTTQDFLSVTSVSASSVINTTAVFGTSTIGGTTWKSANTHLTPVQISAAVTFSSTANSMLASIDYTLDDPTVSSASVVPGGQVASFNAVPAVFTSTAFSSVGGPTVGMVNVAGSFGIPIWGWRMTLTSSSSTAGSVNATVIQAGVG